MLAPSLPLVIGGLALFSSGIFISQSVATVLTGRVVGQARSAAAGLYVTCYYAGGTVGTLSAAACWVKGGWPACVGLFAAISLGTLLFGFLGGRPVASERSVGARAWIRQFKNRRSVC